MLTWQCLLRTGLVSHRSEAKLPHPLAQLVIVTKLTVSEDFIKYVVRPLYIFIDFQVLIS